MGTARKHQVSRAPRLGRLIRRLRAARGLTQERLAERADLSCETVRRLERDAVSPSLETLHRLAAGLDTSLTTLFGAFEKHDEATAREILGMVRRMSGREIVIAVRVLSLLATMLRLVGAREGDDA
jgi:transcriptional regulator with XRE-family HTH domain